MARFENKTVVITGGGSGMGLATAKAFLFEGAKVAICGRKKEKLEKAAEKLGKPDNLLICTADVSKIDDLDRMYDTVTKKFGKVNVVFANAGVGTLTHIEDCDEDTFDKIVSVTTSAFPSAVKRRGVTRQL